jgi:DNA-binding response OmpR family regulator
MTPTEPIPHRVLLVDDDDAVRYMMTATLEHKGFEVVAASNVPEALKHIVTDNFDVLITDLHMPNPGDGFTVVTAMRHSQPNALTLLVSGHPDVQSAMDAILLEADEIIVKPFEVGKLADQLRDKMLSRKRTARINIESVAAILQRCKDAVVHDWLTRISQSHELNHIRLNNLERTGHLPKLVDDLIVRLRRSNATTQDSDAAASPAAITHGELRFRQGYTPAMLVHESRILQVTLFGTLQNNMRSLDFSLLLPDVMTIADEVDAQLTQSMDSFMNAMMKSAA